MTRMKKYFILAAAALAFAACNQNNPENPDTPDTPDTPTGVTVVKSTSDLMAQSMSANHNFVVGQTVGYMPFFWDAANGDVAEFTTPGGLYAVNNQGVAVGAQGDVEQFAVRYENGTFTQLSVPAGSCGSAAWDITDDGQLMFGFYFNSMYQTRPCYWTADGQLHELPVPTEAEVGFELSGAAVRWASADGSVLLGYLFDNYSTWPAVVWNRQADGSYVCDPICKDYFEDDYEKGKTYMTFGSDMMAISDNGEWIGLVVQAEYDPMNWDVEPAPLQGARFNLKTKKLEIAEDLNAVSAIANNGLALGYSGDSPTQRTGYAWLPGETAPKEFGEQYVSDQLEGLVSLSPMAIAADGKSAAGFAVTAADELFSFVVY